MSKCAIAVITTVWNRKKELSRLYRSLSKQKNKNFIWVIVDDGSDEPLNTIITNWREKSQFDIIFLHEKNSGKFWAYKYASEYLKNIVEWSIVVDSDDVVTSNMIDILYSAISTLDLGEIGVVFPRFMKGLPVDTLWKNVPMDTDILSLKYVYNIPETAILLKHKVLLAAFENLNLKKEHFVSEEIIYNYIAKFGKLKTNKNIFYLAKYQKDGITHNLFHIWQQNPQNAFYLLRSRYTAMSELPFKYKIIGRIKTILNINSLCLKLNKSIFAETPNKKQSILLYIPSLVVKKIRFK